MKLLVKQTLMSPVVSHIALVASRFTYRFGRQSFHISLISLTLIPFLTIRHKPKTIRKSSWQINPIYCMQYSSNNNS